MKLNLRKIASVFTSTVMLGSTMALAAAANYPTPFVKSGSADVAVVWGSAAAASDLVAVTDITADLQAELAAQTATSSGTSSSTSVSGGDYVKLSKSSDDLNLGNSMSGVFGSRVDKDNLPELLADGTYMNDQNTEYDFEQSITLKALTLTHFANSDYNDKEPTIGFSVPSGTAVLDYTLDFTTDAESAVTSGDYADFETTDLSLMGKSYYVLSATNDSTATATTLGKFTLLDSADTAIVAEGETQKVTVGDKEYDISVNYLGQTSVKLDINGQVTNSLGAGDTYKLSDGTYVGVKDILYNSKDTGVSKVEFSIGSGKLELTSGSEIELNDDTVDGVVATIYGTDGSAAKLDKIVLTWTTDEDMFITPTTSLTMPGFGAVKLSMGDFTVAKQEVVSIQNDGDDSIKIEAPIKDGTAKFNILYADANGKWTGIGKASDEKLATTNGTTLTYTATSGNDKKFVLSYATSSEAESYLLSASVDEKDGKNRTTIKNEVTGENLCEDKAAGDVCNIGSASITIDSVTKSGSTKVVSFNATGNNNFNTLYTKEGLKMFLPYMAQNTSTSNGALNLSGTSAGHNSSSFNLYFTEENKDEDIAQGATFYFTLSANSDGKVQVASTNVTKYELEDTDKYEGYVYSDLATKVVVDQNPDQDTAEVEYHGSEAFADVYLTASGATVSSEGSVSTTGSVKKLGSVAVSDAEAASVSSKNLIVVGGSCVNSVAAQLLGGALCGAAFETKAGAGAGSFVIETFSQSGGKVATLVAGYNAADTSNAAKYLTTQSVDTTVGKKYVGTSATSAQLVTTAASTPAA